MLVAAVIVAAGQGTRFGGLKQFCDVGDETVTARTVRTARSVCAHVVLVVPEGYRGPDEGADVVVSGGDTRAASVRAGLNSLPHADVVVVHDAARPLASRELFAAVVGAVEAGADAAVPGLRVTDTLKRVASRDGGIVVVDTVDRSDLMTVQTPQAFRREVIVGAHAARTDATDDAALVEASGGTVVIVPGEAGNLKITEPEDLARVVAALKEKA